MRAMTLLFSKKGDVSGWRTLIGWAIVIAIGIVLFLLLKETNVTQWALWQKIKDIAPFV